MPVFSVTTRQHGIAMPCWTRSTVTLDDLVARPRFMKDAACREHPETVFFIDRGGDTRPAKAVCAGCLVRAECLAYALEEHIAFGIWGGMSERERRRLRGGRRSGSERRQEAA